MNFLPYTLMNTFPFTTEVAQPLTTSLAYGIPKWIYPTAAATPCAADAPSCSVERLDLNGCHRTGVIGPHRRTLSEAYPSPG